MRQWPGNGADLGFESVVRDTHALLLCAVHLPAVAAIPPVQIATATARIPSAVRCLLLEGPGPGGTTL